MKISFVSIRILFAFALLIVLRVDLSAQYTQQGPKLVGTPTVGHSIQGHTVTLSADGNTLAEGGVTNDSGAGGVWVFTRSAGTWTQQGGRIYPTDTSGRGQFGTSVALSADGNTLLIGAPTDSTPPSAAGSIGAAWVFTRSGSTWTQQGNKLVGGGRSAFGLAGFGESVSLSSDGNTALIGGFEDSTFVGATWVFTRSLGVWSQYGSKLVGNGVAGHPDQGYAVALSGDGMTAIVGGFTDSSHAGATWIFSDSAGTWVQQGNKLVGTGASGINPFQGHSVSISSDGNTAVEGGVLDSTGIGAVWVFTRSGGAWSQQGSKLVGTGGNAGVQEQGASVALSSDGNTLLVGGPADSVDRGAAWVFQRSGSVWGQLGSKIVGSGVVDTSGQGTGVAMSSDASTIAVGGTIDNTFIGATWVFTRQTNDTIFFSVGPHGSEGLPGMLVVPAGVDTTVVFIPDARYQVANVLIDSVSVGAVTGYTFHSISANHTVSVTFAPQPAYTNTYRTFTYDSLIAAKEVKKKFVSDHWEYLIENNTGSAITEMNLEFKNSVDAIVRISTTGTDTVSISEGAKKVWTVTSSSVIQWKEVVTLIGRTNKKKSGQILTKLWLGPEIGPPTEISRTADSEYIELPMPNALSIIDDAYARGAFADSGGMIVGVRRADSSKVYGWVRMKKAMDFEKSMYDKVAGLHTLVDTGFSFTKEAGDLSPKKHNNLLFADVAALQMNIALSDEGTTPTGLGDLIYSNHSSALDGTSLRALAQLGDQLLTEYTRLQVPLGFNPSLFVDVDTTIEDINKAFSGAIDTVNWSDSLRLTGVGELLNVSFLNAPRISPTADRRAAPSNANRLPNEPQLYQNYPNPFNPTTAIRFDLPQNAVVTLIVYNILGQQVTTLINHEQMPAGERLAQFNASNLPSGIYFYRVTAQMQEGKGAGRMFTDVKKMVLIK